MKTQKSNYGSKGCPNQWLSSNVWLNACLLKVAWNSSQHFSSRSYFCHGNLLYNESGCKPLIKKSWVKKQTNTKHTFRLNKLQIKVAVSQWSRNMICERLVMELFLFKLNNASPFIADVRMRSQNEAYIKLYSLLLLQLHWMTNDQ